MNLKTKVKSYSFWVSLASAVILILKLVGQKFGFSVDEGLISDLFTSLCAILVIMGIIVVPSPSSIDQKSVSNEKINVTSKTIEEQDKVEEKRESFESEIVTGGQVEEKLVENQQTEKIFEEDVIYKQNNENIQTIESQKVEETELVNLQSFENKETIISETENLPAASFSLESFIDKVCMKRNELSENVVNFVEFLQNEIDNIKNK